MKGFNISTNLSLQYKMIAALKTRVPIQVFKLQFPQTKMKLFDGLVFQKKSGQAKKLQGLFIEISDIIIQHIFPLEKAAEGDRNEKRGRERRENGKINFPKHRE